LFAATEYVIEPLPVLEPGPVMLMKVLPTVTEAVHEQPAFDAVTVTT
jgi:hypothetical protein